MKIPGVKLARLFMRWARARVLGGAIILGYHRVARVSRDTYGICVTPEHFEEHLQVLNKYARPISLSELVQRTKDGTLPAKSVAVTFDDGYADNLYEAKPLLEKYDIPATLFVSTGYLGENFWWDELEMLVLTQPVPSQALSLELDVRSFTLSFGDDPRKGLEKLYQRLRGMTPEALARALQQIRSWRGGPLPMEARALTEGELSELASFPLIEIGSHTVTHPALADCSEHDQAYEIQQSKAVLENLLNHPVVGFSFPNGSFSTETKYLVERAYTFACTSERNVVLKGSDPFALPRFWPADWDGERFARWLTRWL